MIAIWLALVFSSFTVLANADTLVSDSSSVIIIEGESASTAVPSHETSNMPEEGDTLADHKAEVYHVEGEAKILESEKTEWAPLQKGSEVEQGDQVRTGADATVEIHYDEFLMNSLRIEPDTVVEFRSIEPTDIYLTDGSVFSNLEGLPEGTSYQIATPTAVASVRGTQFLKEYAAATQMEKTCVLDGTVEVAALDQSGAVNWNQKMEVKADQTLEYDRKTLMEKGFQTFQPKPMQGPLKQRVQTMRRECHQRLENFSGRENMEKAKTKWREMKAQPEKMRPIVNRMQEHPMKKNFLEPKGERPFKESRENKPVPPNQERREFKQRPQPQAQEQQTPRDVSQVKENSPLPPKPAGGKRDS